MPDTDAKTDAQRLCAAIDAVFGDDSCAKLLQFLKDLLAAQVANPDIYLAPDTAGPCTAVTVFFDTNRPDLYYDVLLFKLPDTTNPIFSYPNVKGSAIFGVEFPATDINGDCLFEAGCSYRVAIRVHPPGVGNSSYTDIVCAGGIPIYRPDGEGGNGQEVATAGNGSRTKPAAVAVEAAIPKPASKPQGKSKK
jgi:hypothetical protein